MNLVLILFLSTNLFATREDYPINAQYRGGPNLIYNCNKKLFVCASNVAKEDCEEERKAGMDLKVENYPCAVLKTFTTKKECLEKNYEYVNVNALKKYCRKKRESEKSK